MPNPTNSAMHQDRPLENYTVAIMQKDDSFILWSSTGGSFEEVDSKSDTYYVYNDGDLNRMEMQPRGPSEESHGAGWRLSTDSYKCGRQAVHKDWDISDTANADAAVSDTDQDAEVYLGNQGRMYGDYLMSTEVFKSGVWTDDITGVTTTPVVGTSVTQWDDASADPQADVFEYSERLAGRIAEEPNTMIAGAVLHSRTLQNPVIRDAIKYTQLPTKKAILAALANYFGVERYFVARAFRNTAEENATKNFEYICDSKSMWLGYVSQTSGRYNMSAFKMFAYKHNGLANKGVIVRTMDIPLKTSIRHEIEVHWDVKVVAADAGAMFSSLVA